MFADGAQETVEKESASMCVVGVFLRGHRDHDGMEDKMLMAEALNNTGWTSADAERIGLLRIRPAMCGSAFTGAHGHHHLERHP